MEMSGYIHAPDALPMGKDPRYPLHRRLGGPQSRSESGVKKKKVPSLPLLGIEHCRSVCSLVTIVTELSWLLCCVLLHVRITLVSECIQLLLKEVSLLLSAFLSPGFFSYSVFHFHVWHSHCFVLSGTIKYRL
jgi:hypothetical protein